MLNAHDEENGQERYCADDNDLFLNAEGTQ